MSASPKRNSQNHSGTPESNSFPKTTHLQAVPAVSQPVETSTPCLPASSIHSGSEQMPVEVQWVMAHLRAEPETLAQKREALLEELDARIALTQGSLQLLLLRLREVLRSRRPGAAFQPRVASEFAQALAHYKLSAEAVEPPAVIGQCFLYLREHVKQTGLAPLLTVVDTTPSLKKVCDTWRPWHQQRL